MEEDWKQPVFHQARQKSSTTHQLTGLAYYHTVSNSDYLVIGHTLNFKVMFCVVYLLGHTILQIW